MKKRRWHESSWYSLAVAISIGVVVYVALSQFAGIWAGIKTFIGYFTPVIMGGVIAYMVNPLANFINCQLSKVLKKAELNRIVSNSLAFLVVILFFIFAGSVLIPQLVKSLETFVRNLDVYQASVNGMLEQFGLANTQFNIKDLVSSSETILVYLSEMIEGNMSKIISTFASAGKGIFQWVIAFIFAIYFLSEKPKLVRGCRRFLRALVGEDKYGGVSIFLKKCDTICSRYIVFNMIDSLIIGTVNAIFMTFLGMQYMGMISFVVGITNLIPTFGPLIGTVIGGFVLLMVNPLHSLIFIIFTLILQIVDGYILKPRLFGDSLGVSGLWILMGIIVGSNMFGILGILLAIPCVAIFDFIYGSYIIPSLEKRFD